MKLINRIKTDRRAAGGVISFYMTVLIVAIIVLSVSIPLIVDQVNSVSGSPAVSTYTLTGNVTCGEYFNLTFPDATYVKYQANFTGGLQKDCTLASDAEAWPLNAWGNDSVNATVALETALNDDDTGNISGRLVFDNPSDGVLTMTYYIDGTVGNSMSGDESTVNGTMSDFTGGTNEVSAVAQTILNLLSLMIVLGALLLIMRPLM